MTKQNSENHMFNVNFYLVVQLTMFLIHFSGTVLIPWWVLWFPSLFPFARGFVEGIIESLVSKVKTE